MNIIFLGQKPVFFFGFLIGFISFLLFKYANNFIKLSILYGNNLNHDLVNNWSKYEENYKLWRDNQNIKDSELNLDAYLYGNESNNTCSKSNTILEADWLKKKISITCVIFVKRLKSAITIKDTWGKNCNNLLFFSENLFDYDLPVINLEIKYSSSWHLLCEVMYYIWKNKGKLQLEWLIFVKDDTFVITENLRLMLAPYNFQQAFYLGHAVVLWGLPYNVAQAGYVLSYETLNRLMTNFNTSNKCTAGGKYWNKEDYYLAKHLASLEIYPSDTRDSNLQGTFHGFSLSVLLWGVAKPGHYYTRALYPLSPKCCSTRTVTFNVGDTDKMRTLNYILYHLHVFKKGVCGNVQAPTPIPESEVWKIALREEFNLTDIQEMSNEQYFQIWRSKYSEPERFISNFRAKPVPLDSNLEPYENL